MKVAISIILIAVITVSAVGAFAYYSPDVFQGLMPHDVLSISQINLQQNGIEGANGELTGGNWRVLATTGSADTYFLQLNQSALNNYGSKAIYPDDVQITGSITFGAFQTYHPYWYVPVEKIQDVTVYPQMSGSYKAAQTSSYTIPPMTVTLWQTRPSQMELIIPFSIGVIKTLGTDLGAFTTNYPGAKIQQTSQGNYYTFSISAEAITSGALSNIITFTNPNDPKETIKITLQFTVNSAYQFPTEPWVIITEQNGGEVHNNIFPYADLQTILNVLDYTRGYEWSYYHYLYGGGVFKAHGHAAFGSGSSAYPDRASVGTWSDGSIAPQFVRNVPPYGLQTFVIDEGYSYPTDQQNTNYDLPGWYVPAPTNPEGIQLSGDYYNYRLPLAGTLHNDLPYTQPVAFSVLNYLTQALTVQNQVKPFVLQRINVNYWGEGGQGDCPTGIGVAIPKGARQWLFTLDVSTDAVDTVVVVQNYIDVKIRNFNLNTDTIGKDQTATITCTLENLSPFAGTVSVGVNVPASLSYGVQTYGGTGLLRFEPAGTTEATQQFSFNLRNMGNFDKDTSATLTLTVTNTEPRVTDQESFTLSFLKGLGVPNTSLTVNAQDADTNQPVSGLNVQVFYGLTMDEALSPVMTQDGSATFDLDVYSGYAKIVVTDSADRYESQTKTVGPLVYGVNDVTFKMVNKDTSTTGSNLLELIIIVAIIVIAIVITALITRHMIKRKK